MNKSLITIVSYLLLFSYATEMAYEISTIRPMECSLALEMENESEESEEKESKEGKEQWFYVTPADLDFQFAQIQILSSKAPNPNFGPLSDFFLLPEIPPELT